MLSLPDTVTAGLFDLVGVLTQTAKVHAAAWKQMFDEYLHRRAEPTGEPLRAFDTVADYDAYVDGIVAEREGLRGKPAPDTFLAGARALGVEPEQGAVFEDALAGVQAGRAGGFGFVDRVDRVGQREALLAHRADIVVEDLAELL